MMTPKEVASSTFPKAAIGGYNMAAVDVFLDKLTEDYENLYKENASLKAKIKVLVDKMEEYHAMEDTMRSTLLTAQKMATDMVTEAEKKRDALMAAAETDARARMLEITAEVAEEEKRLTAFRADIDAKIAVEQARLNTAKEELGTFVYAVKRLCSKQLDLLGRITELDILPAGFKPPEDAPQTDPAPETVSVNHEIPAVKMPDPVDLDNVTAEVPVEEAVSAEAMAEVVEDLGGDAGSLMENLRSVIDSFANAGVEPREESPFEIGFDDADKLFDEDPGESDSAAAPKNHYDNFENEETGATRVLKDLQFGRNYNKD